MKKVVFLDIDGVVLPTAAWAMPANAEARRLRVNRDIEAACRVVTFDAVAVGLVIRLCEQAGAKIVILSSWRMTFSPEFTREKLVDQGIPPELFHEDYACPVVGRRGSDAHVSKNVEMRKWLSSHPETEHYVVLDDDTVSEDLPHDLRLTLEDGFQLHQYRVALRALVGTDPAFGVNELPSLVERPAAQDAFLFACWLEGLDVGYENAPARLLDRVSSHDAMFAGLSVDELQSRQRAEFIAMMASRQLL